ncbi:MAG: ATP-binding protein [Verrucomicrobiota bacterium]
MAPFQLNSVHSRTLAIALASAVIPVLLLWLFFWFYTRPSLQAERVSSRVQSLEQVALLLETHLSETVRGLEAICSSPPLLDDSKEHKEVRHNELVRLNELMFRELFLLDGRGFLVASSSGVSNSIQEYSPCFKQALSSGRTVVSEPFRSEDKSTILLSFYIPTPVSDSQSVRAIKANRELDPNWNILSSVNVEKEGEVLLIDADGNILFSSSGRSLFSKVGSADLVDTLKHQRDGIVKVADSPELCYFSVPVDSYKREEAGREWSLVTLVPKSVVFADLAETNRGFGLAILIAVLVITPISVFLVRLTTAPLIALSAASKRAGAGDLRTQVPHFGVKEVDQLGASFNRMLSSIAEAKNDLEKKVEDRTQELSEALSVLSSSKNSIEDGLLILDGAGNILDANEAFNQIFCEDVEFSINSGSTTSSLEGVFKDWLCDRDFDAALKSDLVIEEEWCHTLRAHQVVSVYSAPILNGEENIGRVWVFRDLTSYRALEDELRQSQKMEAIGTLAGGIAHDFNNLLTAINGNLSLSLSQLDEGSEPHQMVSSALSVTGRASGLVKQLLGFSRKSKLEIESCDLGGIADETCGILSHTLDPSIEVTMERDKDLWTVDADQNQMQQILMNLCVNARDAVEKDGQIAIKLKNSTPQEVSHHFAGRGEFNVGNHVCLEVSDSGCGMPLEVRKKIFDPFFTTKEQGKGTGLGLSTCYGIIKQHNGWMECDSEPGKGATMRVYLPQGELVEDEADVEQDDGADTEFEPSKYTVLIADDEPTVRSIAEIVLRRAGYQLVTADDGAEALQIVKERGGELDLVMLDYTMPVMDGKEAFKQISSKYPDVPVMICSGYLCDFKEFETADGLIPASFVQKPYPLKELLGNVADSIQKCSQAA